MLILSGQAGTNLTPAIVVGALGYTPENVANKSTDGTFAANSDTLYPSQKAVKTYVDAVIVGGSIVAGGIDCSANPNYPAATGGTGYYVTVAGKIGGASGEDVEIGDLILCITTSAGGTHAAVGDEFIILQNNLKGALIAANNLSDVASASTARTNLGLAIGTHVQAYSANLDEYAAVNPTAAGLAILDDADAAAQRVTLGVEIGVNVQAYDAELAALAGTTSAADKGLYYTGAGTAGTFDLTSVARTLLAQSSQANMRSTGLGLGTAAVMAGPSGAIVGTTDSQTLTNKTLTAPVINSPTGIVKGDVGLGNVDNTSDANKPISTATQTALDGKISGAGTVTDNAIPRFDGTLGLTLQNSVVTIADTTGVIAGSQGINIAGSTSGAVNIRVAATAGSNTLTFPAGTTDFSATGGSGQFVKQLSAGGAFTVATLLAAEMPSTIDAAKIADGTVSNAEFQYIGGLTSDAQTQITAKFTNSVTAFRILGRYSGTTGVVEELSLGTGLQFNGSTLEATGGALPGGTTGNVDNAVLRADGTGGSTAQASVVIIADTTGIISGTQGVTFTGSSSGTTALVPTAAASGTLTLPAATDTLVGRDTTDTLTNKTLTAPRIANGGFIADANGNEQIKFVTTGSAVNDITVTNAATGANPQISATGGDTDIGLDFLAKGAGVFNFKSTTSGAAEIRIFEDADNGSNYVAVKVPATLGSNYTVTLPAGTTDFSATGGSGQFLRQSSAGAAITVAVIDAADLPTGIDAAKIADGSVSNTEFQYISTLSSNAQTQISAKFTNSMSTDKLLGRGTASTGVVEEITLGTGLELDGTTLNVTVSGGIGGDTGGTDNAILRADGTGGATVQTSPVTIADTTGVIAGTQGITFTGPSSGTTALVPTAAASGTLTLPAATDTLVGKATTDTLTNKTINLTSNTLSGTIAQFNTAVSDADLATLAGTETLSGKTLTAPRFADLGFIADANGNELLVMDTVTSAVNEFRIENAATGTGPIITVQGGDTNVPFNFQVKGTGTYNFLGTVDTPAELRLYEDTDNGTHYAGIIAPASMAANRTLTLPDATDTLAGIAATQTFTNKTVNLTSNTLTGTIAQFNTALSDGDFATLAGSETLTNKTLTSPVLTTPTLGTPASGTLTNCSGLPIAGLVNSTSAALGLGSIELGHASDTTLARVSAGVVSIEGVNIVTESATQTLTNKTLTSPTLTTPVLGTPSSGTLTNCSGLPVSGITASTSTALGVGSVELGHASDTTIARVSAGVISVEGVTVPTISSTNTFTNKRVTPRTGTTTSSATPTINTDNVDFYSLTAQTADITSFTSNLSGTPTDGQRLWIAITGTGARAITWGSSFEASTVALPTTTVSTNRLDVGFVWNAVTSKWRCVASA